MRFPTESQSSDLLLTFFLTVSLILCVRLIEPCKAVIIQPVRKVFQRQTEFHAVRVTCTGDTAPEECNQIRCIRCRHLTDVTPCRPLETEHRTHTDLARIFLTVDLHGLIYYRELIHDLSPLAFRY